jgi:AcrR family transcriptional regulator
VDQPAPSPRLDAEERRARIVDAVMPVFARKGFAGTTTKELAEAAGVSEALLYKHFPNKEAMYREMLAHMPRRVDDEMLRIRSLEPGTEALIESTEFLLRRFLTARAEGRERLMNMHRLVLHSLTEDGEFARLVYERISGHPLEKFLASLEAARQRGHLVDDHPIDPRLAFWFQHHLIAQLAYTRLPEPPVIDHSVGVDTLLRQALLFILRGLGLREEVIRELLLRPGSPKTEDEILSSHRRAADER